METPAPVDIMPLFLRAGSIVPLGPRLQYSSEKPADPIELRIYPGADGRFTLYEDENDGYGYDKGEYAEIPFVWDNMMHRLTIENRQGLYPGMLAHRTFNIVLVRKNHGVGDAITSEPDTSLVYTGKKMFVQL